VFCSKTSTNKPLLGDLIVEKSVGHTRIFDGKFATKAIKSGALEKNAASLPERVAMRQQGLRLAPARTGASSKSRDVKLVLSNVGLEMLRWCEVHSIFVLGSPMVTSKGGEVIGAGKLFNPEGVEIRPEVLDFDSTGGDRYAKYVAEAWLGSTYPTNSVIERKRTRFGKELVLQ
jgi:hypothetical protein